jgi:hypothetical protein
MERVDFNTIQVASPGRMTRIEIRETAILRCEAKRRPGSVTLSRETQAERVKFGMCEDRLRPNCSSPGLYPASKGTDEGSVVGTEKPVFSFPTRRSGWT